MSDPTLSPAPAGRSAPVWLSDLLEALHLRRRLAIAVAGGMAVLALVVSLVLPELLPSRGLVGALVGVFAGLMAVLVAVVADASDDVIRGTRHVRGTGAVIAAAGHDPIDQVTSWAQTQLAEGGQLRVALVPAGSGNGRAGTLADRLAVRLARHDLRVLVCDLTRPTSAPGVAEVAAGQMALSQAASVDDRLGLARLGAGRELGEALAGVPAVARRVGEDVDALVLALPGLDHPGSLPAAAVADRSLMLATVDQTNRVDVLAGLEALESAQTPAELVLLQLTEPSSVRWEAGPPRGDAADFSAGGEEERWRALIGEDEMPETGQFGDTADRYPPDRPADHDSGANTSPQQPGGGGPHGPRGSDSPSASGRRTGSDRGPGRPPGGSGGHGTRGPGGGDPGGEGPGGRGRPGRSPGTSGGQAPGPSGERFRPEGRPDAGSDPNPGRFRGGHRDSSSGGVVDALEDAASEDSGGRRRRSAAGGDRFGRHDRPPSGQGRARGRTAPVETAQQLRLVAALARLEAEAAILREAGAPGPRRLASGPHPFNNSHPPHTDGRGWPLGPSSSGPSSSGPGLSP